MEAYYNIKEIKLFQLVNYNSCILISYTKNSNKLSYEFFTILKKYIYHTDFVKINTDELKDTKIISQGFTFFKKIKNI
jgi:hypothetical protein